ncbi:MAG TPA: 1,2-phenylacetyl-CoA epoxidase subunit PaaD [Streptosporangiaceae bacterium]|nr:1,2-phenylacetyl-CoA epoxidase subunit PaaD [Streptosporangiaceae bacterium]
MVTELAATELLTRAWEIAAAVPDPELPALTVADLGILREVTIADDRLIVYLTPTYSGCPALPEMRRDVASRLADAGFAGAEVRAMLSPPWSTDMITSDGRRKLAEAGLAPPRSVSKAEGPVPLTLFAGGPPVACPRCGSAATERTAAFGSTACKDLRRCRACGEPFEHIKEI